MTVVMKTKIRML